MSQYLNDVRLETTIFGVIFAWTG